MVTSKNSREASGEGFFRQSKQKFARIVDPIRRIFVTNDGKSTANSSAVEFLEVTYIIILPQFHKFFKSLRSFYGQIMPIN